MQSQEPDNHTNLLIAVVLSMAVLFTWQIFFDDPSKRRKPQQPATQTEQTTNRPTDGAAPTAPGAAGPGTASAPSTTTPQVPGADRDAAIGGSGRVVIETEALKGSINLNGARIDDLTMMRYRDKVDPQSPNVILFSPSKAPNPYFAEFGWLAQPAAKTPVPGGETPWRQVGSGKLTSTSPLKLEWDNGQGQLFRRTISIDDNYLFTIRDEVENKGGAAVTFFPYARIYRYGTPKIEGFFIQHEGLIGWLGEDGLQEHTYSDVQDEDGSQRFSDVTGGWIGITDKYWASALVPDQSIKYTANMKLASPASARTKEAFQTDYIVSGISVAPGETKAYESRLYAGAKKVGVIEKYQEEFKIEQFDLMVDWGWFYFITKPLYYAINWFYNLFGNFGLAILAVTVIVKVLFFPLANKSYESMARMKKLQPQMEQLRDRFKDDKQRQQQELMKLYQEEKINPMAGCLPVLLQIPVFFALYKVLFISIDMRHAPFYGWIQDLSAPDPTSIFNLFGLLPYDVPGFLLVGVWPLIMGITMWLQMQLNPPQPDPTQQAVFNWMPVIFTFLLATFPAGLVIYWAWNNVLSLIQQYYIMRKNDVEVALADNLRATFSSVAGLGDKAKKSASTLGTAAKKSATDLKERSSKGTKKSDTPKSARSDDENIIDAEIVDDTADAVTGTESFEHLADTPRSEKDALAILGLKQGASRRQVTRAYKRLTKAIKSASAPEEASANLSLAKDMLLKK